MSTIPTGTPVWPVHFNKGNGLIWCGLSRRLNRDVVASADMIELPLRGLIADSATAYRMIRFKTTSSSVIGFIVAQKFIR